MQSVPVIDYPGVVGIGNALRMLERCEQLGA